MSDRISISRLLQRRWQILLQQGRPGGQGCRVGRQTDPAAGAPVRPCCSRYGSCSYHDSCAEAAAAAAAIPGRRMEPHPEQQHRRGRVERRGLYQAVHVGHVRRWRKRSQWRWKPQKTLKILFVLFRFFNYLINLWKKEPYVICSSSLSQVLQPIPPLLPWGATNNFSHSSRWAEEKSTSNIFEFIKLQFNIEHLIWFFFSPLPASVSPILQSVGSAPAQHNKFQSYQGVNQHRNQQQFSNQSQQQQQQQQPGTLTVSKSPSVVRTATITSSSSSASTKTKRGSSLGLWKMRELFFLMESKFPPKPLMAFLLTNMKCIMGTIIFSLDRTNQLFYYKLSPHLSHKLQMQKAQNLCPPVPR